MMCEFWGEYPKRDIIRGGYTPKVIVYLTVPIIYLPKDIVSYGGVVYGVVLYGGPRSKVPVVIRIYGGIVI